MSKRPPPRRSDVPESVRRLRPSVREPVVRGGGRPYSTGSTAEDIVASMRAMLIYLLWQAGKPVTGENILKATRAKTDLSHEAAQQAFAFISRSALLEPYEDDKTNTGAQKVLKFVLTEKGRNAAAELETRDAE